MTATDFRDQEFITKARDQADAILTAIETLLGMQIQWNALDYSTALPIGAGANEGILASQVGSVVFDTANALKAVLDAGHATNLSKIR